MICNNCDDLQVRINSPNLPPFSCRIKNRTIINPRIEQPWCPYNDKKFDIKFSDKIPGKSQAVPRNWTIHDEMDHIRNYQTTSKKLKQYLKILENRDPALTTFDIKKAKIFAEKQLMKVEINNAQLT